MLKAKIIQYDLEGSHLSKGMIETSKWYYLFGTLVGSALWNLTDAGQKRDEGSGGRWCFLLVWVEHGLWAAWPKRGRLNYTSHDKMIKNCYFRLILNICPRVPTCTSTTSSAVLSDSQSSDWTAKQLPGWKKAGHSHRVHTHASHASNDAMSFAPRAFRSDIHNIAESDGFAGFTSAFQAEVRSVLEGSRWLSIIRAISVPLN